VKLGITPTIGGKLRVLNPRTGQIVEQKTKPGELIKL
jgi:translation elongation factor EF-G